MNYENIYQNLILHAKSRVLDEGVAIETHHITPRCLGGTNLESNLAKLLPREHLVAHKLLARIHPLSPGLLFALTLMVSHPNSIGEVWCKLSSRDYEKLAREKSNFMKINNPMFNKELVHKRQTTTKRRREAGAYKKKVMGEAHKKILSDNMKVNNPSFNPEVRARSTATRNARLASGDLVMPRKSAKEKKDASDRMRGVNPMHNPEVALRSAATFKARIESGDLILVGSKWMRNTEGNRAKASGVIPKPKIVRRPLLEYLKNDNPMKNPEIAKKGGETFKRNIASGVLKLIDGKWRNPLKYLK